MTLNHVEIEVGVFMTSIPYAIHIEILAIRKLGFEVGMGMSLDSTYKVDGLK